MNPKVFLAGAICATITIFVLAVVGWEGYEVLPCLEHKNGTFIMHNTKTTYRKVKFIYLSRSKNNYRDYLLMRTIFFSLRRKYPFGRHEK